MRSQHCCARRIRAHNTAKYGKASPGNAYCGTETIEPAAAAQIFEELLKPSVASGALRIERGWEPVKASVEGNRVAAVEFARRDEKLTVKARLTMDAND